MRCNKFREFWALRSARYKKPPRGSLPWSDLQLGGFMRIRATPEDIRAQMWATTCGAGELPKPQGRESAGETRQKGGRGCNGDQIDRPGMVAPAYEVEMSGVSFVSICVEAHGCDLLLHVRKFNWRSA